MSRCTRISSSNAVEERWSEANFSAMASLWEFTEEEQAKMRQLQQKLSDIDHWKNDPYEVVRYLVEYYFQVDKAAKMFRSMVEWRIANHMDTFLTDYGMPPEIFQYLPLFLLRDLDYEGDPLYVLRVGALDAWGLYQQTGRKAVLDYTKFLQEITTTRHCIVKGDPFPAHWNWQTEYYEQLAQRRLRQRTMIVDLEGLSHKHLRPALFSVLQAFSRIDQDDNAGFERRIILFPAPRIFSLAWNLVKHFFDAHIQALLCFTTSTNYLEVCDQYLDRKSLPVVMCPDEGRGMISFPL